MEMGGMLNTMEAARVLAIEPRTLESWRLRGSGPRFVKVGRLVRYSRRDLETWLASRVRASTSADRPPREAA